MIIRLIPFLVAMLAWLPTAEATAQFPDKLRIEGQEVELFCNPLSQYHRDHPNTLPEEKTRCTALWRGYVATFAIDAGAMRVVDVEMLKSGGNLKFYSVLKKAIPKVEDRAMSWFTGLLVIPRGKRVEYVHMGYASTYESYRLIFVRSGRVRADRIFTAAEYDEYRSMQFEEFKKTKRYQDDAEATRKAGGLDPDAFLSSFEVDFASDIPLDYKDFVLGLKPASDLEEEAQPGATDNPDDAQHLREDH